MESNQENKQQDLGKEEPLNKDQTDKTTGKISPQYDDIKQIIERLNDQTLDSIYETKDFEDLINQDISRKQSEQLKNWTFQKFLQEYKQQNQKEFKEQKLIYEQYEMKFTYKHIGEKPQNGYSVYISLHGGGGCPKDVNDSQWENQKTLYKPPNCIYICPRGPTDTWNLWHQPHIMPLFRKMILLFYINEEIDINRIYLLGYSAGGDGVYYMAPRMADYWACCSMMAGHPNGSSPLNLRNLSFTLQVGQKDSGYDRNIRAAEWNLKLKQLQNEDKHGYEHVVKIHEGKGHWMDLEDAKIIPYMDKQVRNNFPEKVVWHQNEEQRDHFYYLFTEKPPQHGRVLKVTHMKQVFIVDDIEIKDQELQIGVNDAMVDYEQIVTVVGLSGKIYFSDNVKRSLKNIIYTIQQKQCPKQIFDGIIPIKISNN